MRRASGVPARTWGLLRTWRFDRPGLRSCTVLACLVLSGACKRGGSPFRQPTARVDPGPREITRSLALFFTYVGPDGVLATTDKAEKVPEVARGLVRIMGRAKGEGHWRNNTNVEVINLRELLTRGKTRPRVMSREGFETGALAQLPPGESCLLAGPRGPPLAVDDERAGPPGEPPIVILYGTAWCKACKAASQYLISELIPFTRKDVEKDPSAAAELRLKTSRMGIRADRVPILDVRGRLLVGFDRARMDGQLADW
jgi:glutaredoxin